MTLLQSNAALAQHAKLMRIATILPVCYCDAVQTAAAASTCKVPSLLLLASKSRNCTVMMLVVQRSTGTTWQSDANYHCSHPALL